MSQENVEIMRATFEVWNAGDMDALRELYDPDVIMRMPEAWPEPGPFVGREAVMRHWKQQRTIFDGRGPQNEPEAEHLSRIIDEVNERFGLNLTDADQLLFDQFEQGWIDDPTLAAQAKQNDLANFRFAFDKTFMNTVVTRMDANGEIFKRVLDDKDFRDLLADYYVKKVYDQLREAA